MSRCPCCGQPVADRPVLRLTGREHQVLELASQGMTMTEIAERLGISAWTVRDHCKRIRQAAGVRSIGGAVARAYQAGVLP